MKPKFVYDKDETFSIPLDILKVMEASCKPKFGCKNANDLIRYVILQMFDK